MIKTITLNPAIDKTLVIDNFTINEVNRVKSLRLDAGGKGINVSKIIHSLGGDSIACGIIAGNNGEFIKKELNKNKIKNDFVEVPGETRINLKIVDLKLGTHTDINEQGVEVSKETIKLVEKKIFQDLDKKDILVLSGSVPATVSLDIYKKWIERANKKGIKTILDADRDLLKEGIKASPYLIKPNIHELETLINKKINSIEEMIEAGRELLGYGISIIAISLGSKGALFITRDKEIFAKGIKVEAKSTVGAGDSLVAAMTLAIYNNDSLEEMIKLAIATASAKVMAEGSQSGDIFNINRFKEQVELEKI